MMIRRYQKAIVGLLLLLDLTGARIVTVCDACEHSRVYFSPAVGFKAIARAVTGQTWKRRAPHALGAQANRYSTRDIELVRRDDRPATVNILPPINITIGAERSRNRLVYAWMLPKELSPVKPPQLNPRK
jgi:hypothetical protein